VTLTLGSGSGYVVGSPASASGSIADNDAVVALPVVSVSDATVVEGNSGSRTVTLTVSLGRAAASSASVGWATAATGSAVAGSDFAAASGTVTFAAGETSKTVTVTILADTAVEADETFEVRLSSPSGLTIADGVGVVTIVNDDVAVVVPSLSVSDATVVEGKNGSRTVSVTVSLSAPSSGSVSVSYATAAGTATAGSDYASTSGTLTFTAGQVSKTVSITVYGDRTAEADETVLVNLSGAVGATIADGQGVVTIVNDDGSPLQAAFAPAVGGSAVALLTEAQLDAVVVSAERAWWAVRPSADFSGLTVSVADLEGLTLGVTGANTVTIDVAAAGWGWTVSGGRMDLFTVVLHELGHVLGLEHDPSGGLMGETLAPGVAYRFASTPRPFGTTLQPRLLGGPVRLSVGGGLRLGLAWLFAPHARVITAPAYHAGLGPSLRPPRHGGRMPGKHAKPSISRV
jgi:hypothetical protein